jgi:hypothetical protein
MRGGCAAGAVGQYWQQDVVNDMLDVRVVDLGALQ